MQATKLTSLIMRIFAVVTLLLIVTNLPAQLDSILNISDVQRRHAAFLNLIENSYDPYELYEALLNEAEIKLPAIKDEKLIQELWFYQQELKCRKYKGNDMMEATEPLRKALAYARNKSWTYIQAKIHAHLGSFFFGQERYELGFEHMLKAIDLIKPLNFKENPEIVKITDGIANNYYRFGDHSSAIMLYKKGIGIAPYWKNKSLVFSILNTIGLCYQELMKYDSAIYYYQLANESAIKVENEFWTALTDGNRAYCLYLTGNYNEALPLLITDFEKSAKWDQIGSAVNSAMTIAEIYLKQKNLNDAIKYIEYGKKHKNFLNIRQLVNFYNSLQQISRLRSDYRQALLYQDSMKIYADSAAIIHDAAIIKNAEVKLNIEKHRHELEILESEKSRQILLRNAILIILSLLGIIIAMWFYHQQIKRKRALDLAEAEKTRAVQELDQARKQLQNFTALVREKNELIESVRQELSELEQLNQGEERIRYINELLNSNILTEDDWREFKTLFDKVYPGFFIRLKEKMPQLSPAETRLMALLKLNLSQKDMAYMLGIGYDAIRKSKQRLRSKINQQEELSLEEIVENI